MLKRTSAVAVCAALGLGAAAGISACGEDREGDVQFQGTETAGTTATETTETATTATTATETTGTETAP